MEPFDAGPLRLTPSAFRHEEIPARSIRDQESFASFGRQLGVTAPVAAYSDALSAAARNFEEAAGIAVRCFAFPGRDDLGGHAAFVHPDNPGVIFINARAEAPLGSLLAHEWFHSLAHDPAKAHLRERFALEAARHLVPSRVKIYADDLRTRYGEGEIRDEFLGNLFADAVCPVATFQTDLVAHDRDAIRILAKTLWKEANPLNPSSLGSSDDSDLASFS